MAEVSKNAWPPWGRSYRWVFQNEVVPEVRLRKIATSIRSAHLFLIKRRMLRQMRFTASKLMSKQECKKYALQSPGKTATVGFFTASVSTANVVHRRRDKLASQKLVAILQWQFPCVVRSRKLPMNVTAAPLPSLKKASLYIWVHDKICYEACCLNCTLNKEGARRKTRYYKSNMRTQDECIGESERRPRWKRETFKRPEKTLLMLSRSSSEGWQGVGKCLSTLLNLATRVMIFQGIWLKDALQELP